MTRGRGYIVPEPIDPEATLCLRVYVPADQLYIAAFMRAYQFFGQWVAWERDDTGKAARAAAVWREAIDRTMSEFDCSRGECGIMDIRQSGTVPCVIEKQVGCDGSWEQVVDMRLCVPRMRIHSGVLQQDTTGNGDWSDAGDPEVPYDPRTDSYAPPPWTEPPEGEQGDCLSAANVAAYVDFVAYHFAASMVNGLTFFQTLSAAMVILTALMGLIPLTALTALVTALYETVVDSWEDVRDFSVTSKLTELMVCRFNADGSMSESQFNDLIDDCNTYRNTLADSDERAKWFIAISAMQLWGPVGMTLSGKIWGITTYDCERNECGWEHEFDFTVSDHGFTAIDVFGYDAGQWSNGVGWRGVYAGTQAQDGNYRVWIRSEELESTVSFTWGQVTLTYDEGEKDYRNLRLKVMDEGIQQGIFIEDAGSYAPPPLTEGDISGYDDSIGSQIRLESGNVHNDMPQPSQGAVGGVTVTSIKIRGTGTNPWA